MSKAPKLLIKIQKPVDFVLLKSSAVENEEGYLTNLGMEVAHRYAQKWIEANTRDLTLERAYPDLSGLFFDIRSDSDLARMHAS